jgi:hypothetical protein
MQFQTGTGTDQHLGQLVLVQMLFQIKYYCVRDSDRYQYSKSNLYCGLRLLPFRPLSVSAPFCFGPFPD